MAELTWFALTAKRGDEIQAAEQHVYDRAYRLYRAQRDLEDEFLRLRLTNKAKTDNQARAAAFITAGEKIAEEQAALDMAKLFLASLYAKIMEE